MNIGRQSRKQVRKAKARARGWELRLHPRVLGGMPLAIVGVTLVVYLLTMAPRYTWGYEYFARDGGDFVSAAWNLGVPHPTGYPTYTLLAWLFTRLPWGAAVWRVQLLSGLAGAGTVLLVYHMVRRLAAQDDLSLPAIGAASGAFLLAFARLFWSHSLVVEVYALHLFFIACVLWLMLRWRDGQGPLWLAALVFGLGMGNHSTLTFAGPAMLLLLWDGRKRLAWREVIAAALALAAGLLVYLYLPWRAAANPIVNWGDPDTWAGFRWVVTGEGYQRFFFALPAKEVWPRLQQWGRLTGVQFPILAWPLALMGFWSLGRRDRWLAMGTLVHAAINLIYSIGYDVSDAFVHLLPVYFYAALWMGVGAVALLSVAHEWRPSLRYPGLGIGLVVAGLFLLPGFSLVKEWDRMDLTRDREAHQYAQETLGVVEPGALILVGSDVYTFTLWYYRYVEQMRPDVAVVNYAMMSFEWYQDTIAIHHPDVVQRGEEGARVSKVDLALRNLERRAVYIAKDEDAEEWSGLELTDVGSLWRASAP